MGLKARACKRLADANVAFCLYPEGVRKRSYDEACEIFGRKEQRSARKRAKRSPLRRGGA